MNVDIIKELAILASIVAITIVAALAYYGIKMVTKHQKPLVGAMLELGLGVVVMPVVYMVVFALDDGIMRWIYLLTMAMVGVVVYSIATKITKARGSKMHKKRKVQKEKQQIAEVNNNH